MDFKDEDGNSDDENGSNDQCHGDPRNCVASAHGSALLFVARVVREKERKVGQMVCFTTNQVARGRTKSEALVLTSPLVLALVKIAQADLVSLFLVAQTQADRQRRVQLGN